MRRSSGPIICAIFFALLAMGCKVTSDDIDTWMGTVKGPGKIVAVLLADKYEDDLRVHAGLALVRMEPREDVDGVSELQAALRRLPEETRARLVDGMTPRLVEMMRGEDTPQASTDEATVPPRQVRAKDAAFLLTAYASDAQRDNLTGAVVDWFVVDFNGRNLAGNYTAEQVVRELGAPAASRLVNAMSPRIPQQALVKLAQLISDLGNRETKTRAAARLVEIEQEMMGEEYQEWLRARLRTQMQERDPDQEVDDDRIAAAAALNRENFINLGAISAMKHLNEEASVSDRLLAIAVQDDAREMIVERRVNALRALEGGVRADQVTALLDLALAQNTPVNVRDYAFDRVGDSREASAVTRLWPVFDETEDWRMRWRVGSLILTLGGAQVASQFIGRLRDVEYAHEELYGYGERLAQVRPPPADLMNAQLQAREWYRRCIALFFWERRAEESDLPRITALEGESQAVRGPSWEHQGQETVGQVAAAVARAVRERLGDDEQDSDEDGEEENEGEGG